MQKCLKRLTPLLKNHFTKTIRISVRKPLIMQNTFPFSTQESNQPTGGLTAEEKRNIDYIESGVFELLKSMPKCKQDKLTRTASLEELGFDSLDIVELVIAVEEKFNLTISDDDSVKIQTVQDMIQMFYNYFTGRVKKPEPSTGPSGTI